jgi:hydroxypyruvate isomerase
MDLYHCQIVEGDLIEKIEHHLPLAQVGHLQVAGVPLRQELQFGELNYIDIFRVLDEVAQACSWRGLCGLRVSTSRGRRCRWDFTGFGLVKVQR